MWSLLRSWCLQWWCWLLRRVCNGMRFEWVILKRKINFKPRLNFQVLVRFSSTSPVDLQRCGSVLRKRGPFQMLVRSWVCYCKHWHHGLETMVWRKDPSRKKTLQVQPIGSINTGRVWVLGYTIKICEGVCELKATVFFLTLRKTIYDCRMFLFNCFLAIWGFSYQSFWGANLLQSLPLA